MLGERLHLVLAIEGFKATAAHTAIGRWGQEQTRYLRAGPHFKIRSAITGRPQKCLRGVPAPTAFLVHFEIAHALVGASVEVVAGGYTGLHRSLCKRVQDIPAQALLFNAPFTAGMAVSQGLVIGRLALRQHLCGCAFGAMHVVGTGMVVFVQFEIRQTVLPIPTFVTGEGSPLVVITGLTTHINHAVDAGAAAEHFAARVTQAAPIESVGRFGVIEPIGTRVANAIQIAHGNMHPVVIVLATGFDQQHAFGRVGTQAIGQQATGGTRADDDVVELRVAHVRSMWASQIRHPWACSRASVASPIFVWCKNARLLRHRHGCHQTQNASSHQTHAKPWAQE